MIAETDMRVKKVVDAIDSRPKRSEEEWLIIITTDHGGDTDHGKFNEACRIIPLVLSGDGVK